MKKLSLVLCVLVLLTGCATNFDAVKQQVVSRVDPISVKDQAQFDIDTTTCAEFALSEHERVRRAAFANALAGALIGAAAGAAYGSAFGKQYTGFGAQVGATSGAMAGLSATQSRYFLIMTNCLQHRGYLLLW